MLRRYGTSVGSALDLVQLQESEEPPESRLRRVLTATYRRKKKHTTYCLTSVLKEPLRLVNSVPLNFSRYSSASTDLASRRGVFSRRHYGSVEMLASCEGEENLVRRFRVETGEQGDRDELFGAPSTPVLENPEYQTRWYFKYFLGKLHQNYGGLDVDKNPYFLSVVLTDSTQGVQQYRAIYWRKTGARKLCLSHTPNRPLTIKALLSNFQNADRIEKGPKEIFTPEIQKDLLLLEEQEGSVNFKFGILYAKAGQSTDDEMFSNEFGSKEFETFVTMVADKIRLKGWDKYRGGLDVKGDMTGKHSYYTVYHGHEIMFHVSTCLPFSKDNRQQVERKRHIGNDIVNIIFLDGSPEDHINFKPSIIKSQFTHVFAIFSFDKEQQKYRMSVYSEETVPLFGPTLPNPPLFVGNDDFREFILVKLINGEKAAFNTPTFSQKRERTLDMLIKDMHIEHLQTNDSRGTMLNRRAFSDVLPEAPRGSRRKEEQRQVEFVRIGQSLKLDTIVKGDAPTSLATSCLFKREPWDPLCFYPDFPHDILCGDSWGTQKVVLATESGIFAVEEGLTHRMIFDKTVLVKQLTVVEAHGIFLLRVDKGRDSKVHVFRLSDFEGEINENFVRNRADLKEHKLERTKGCHLYGTSRPGGSHLRMVVAVGRRLLLMQWRHSAAWTAWCATSDTDTVDGFHFIRELPAAEPPQFMTLVDSTLCGQDNQICIGYRHQFDLINEKTGDTLRLHFVDKPKVHLVTAIDIYEDDEAELLLCYNNVTHFQKLYEEDSRDFDFQWNNMPENMICAFPYIMAFTPDNIEIRLIINGNLVHNMPMPRLTLITSKSDIYFSSTAPEFFQVKRERVKEEKVERDSSLSPPSSPHSTGSTGSLEGGSKPIRIYRMSFSSINGSGSPCERRVPTPNIPSPQHTLQPPSFGGMYLSPDAQDRHRPELRPSRSATSSPIPTIPVIQHEQQQPQQQHHHHHHHHHRQQQALHQQQHSSPKRLSKDHNHSSSSDSGLGRSVGSTPPTSPYVFADIREDS